MPTHTPTRDADESVREFVSRDKHGASFVVREYTPALAQDLQRFYEDFQPKRAAQGLPPDDPERIRIWLKAVLASGLHLLAFRDQELIGHCMVMPTKSPEVGEYAVFVNHAERGRGIGTELHRAMIATARAAGLRALWLTVEPQNRAAIRSYEKVGFRFVPGTILSLEPEMEIQL
ncbi:MAG: GNAT family N-acetyltransferase [Gemmatimonadota bacterium]